MPTWITKQIIPLVLTAVSFLFFWLVLFGEIHLLNLTSHQKISTTILLADILVGFTIYIKTSIDFAIFIGHLMRTNSGWKNRIAIETGTAAGNAVGTFLILAIWSFFSHINWLLAIMVFLSALVLFRLAEDGLEHAPQNNVITKNLRLFLSGVNRFAHPLVRFITPQTTLGGAAQPSWKALLWFSATIPFILGLDDFAGYVPLFSIVHVYGFAIGVLAGHMVLNICLFLSPDITIKIVKQPIISLFGSVAFIGLAVWGLVETWHILSVYF